MPDIVVNPGAARTHGSLDQARVNLNEFAVDVARELQVNPDTAVITERSQDPDDWGHYLFTLAFGDGPAVEIDMPGVDLAEIRFTGAEDQNIWDFVRLYVAGSSWVWKYAIGACADEM